MIKRAAGVLMPISCLPGEYSIGSFGREALRFVDFLKECGFTYWQVLPFCMVDECNSPYKSYSAFGGNPYFIDLDILASKGLVTDAELEEYRQQTPYSCEYVRLYHTRFPLLKKAAQRTDAQYRKKVEAFIDNDEYLLKVCEFMALKEANGQLPWNEWTIHTPDADVLYMWKFIQYEFFTQWETVKSYANSKGISIIGDIPIYVAYDSCDVWSNKELFLLDRDNKPRCVAGVPPDYFSADGQLWGNPLYDWKKMEKDGYAWWCGRMEHMFRLFDCVRIDHFRGLESFWSVPADAETAREGKWVKGPGKKFINAIKKVAGDKMIIAEDLGDITPEVAKLVEYSGFPGMRVLQFAFLSDEDNPHMPHSYVNNCIAYTGTHDNNTLLGYVWELDTDTRKKLMDYCGYTDPCWDKCYDSVIRTVFASAAGLVVMPVQDLLGYGSDTRINIPGKADGNWRYRVTREQLDGIDKEKYRKLHFTYKR